MRKLVFLGTAAALIFLLGAGGLRAQSPDETITAPQMLEQVGTIDVKVADYDTARAQVLAAAASQGAELLDARTDVNQKGRKHGWVHFQIAASHLPGLLAAIQGAGKVSVEKVDSSDHTSDYEELARRVSSLRQHEQRLTGVLTSPRRMRGSDILYLQERLFRATVDEGMLLQQRQDMERATQASMVTAELFEPGSLPPSMRPALHFAQWFANAALFARSGLAHTLARGTTATAYLFIYAPLWAPLLVVAVALLCWLWRLRFALLSLAKRAALRLAHLLVAVVRWTRAIRESMHKPLTHFTDDDRRTNMEA